MCEQQIKKIFLDLSSLFIKKKKYIGTSLNDFNYVISTLPDIEFYICTFIMYHWNGLKE